MSRTHLINQLKIQAKAMAEAGSEGWSRTTLAAVHELENQNTIQSQQSDAWIAISKLLTELKPDWMETDDPNITVLDLAMDTISEFKNELNQAQEVIGQFVVKENPPQFPTTLRKMWSGTEIQDWINRHWYGKSKEEKPIVIPCPGCGNSNSIDRCLGCIHSFW